MPLPPRKWQHSIYCCMQYTYQFKNLWAVDKKFYRVLQRLHSCSCSISKCITSGWLNEIRIELYLSRSKRNTSICQYFSYHVLLMVLIFTFSRTYSSLGYGRKMRLSYMTKVPPVSLLAHLRSFSLLPSLNIGCPRIRLVSSTIRLVHSDSHGAFQYIYCGT